ncbi:MAG: mechanosensitive ion channel family protein [Fimbriimonadaceae bacterium]
MRQIKFIALLLIYALPLFATAQTSVPETLENPRATLTTFFNAMNEFPPDVDEAAKTLDLSDLPEIVRDSQSPNLAIQLFGIFNRTKFIELQKVTNDPNSGDVILDLRSTKSPELANILPIVIRKSADGAWRFSPQTVAHIPQTFNLVKNLPVIQNLKDIQPAQSIYVSWAENNLTFPWLAPGFLGVAPWKWVGLIIAAVASYLAGLFIRVIVKLFIRLKAGKLGSELSKATLDSAGHGFSLLTVGTVFTAFSRSFQLVPDVKAGTLFISLIFQTIGLAWLAMAIVEFTINRLTPKVADAERAEKLFLPILRNFGRIIIIGLALLFFLERIGFNVTGLIAGLGIGGIVVALAAKDSVENIFGSLTLIFEMPFQIGDWVKADGIEGTVEEISLRSTTLRTVEDSTILVPNSKFISNAVENMGRRRYRRLKTFLGITYDATPDQIETFVKSLRQYVLEHPKTWDDKINIAFNNYGPSSLDIIFIVFIDAPTYSEELLVREELLLGVMRIADECNIHFAFPTQRMIIERMDSAAGTEITGEEKIDS